MEIAKLLKAGLIREVKHPKWFANPKATDKWCMCVDFTNLNTASPKDDSLLPRIDQLIDATSGCELMSFLDAYSGYHQVFMAKEDEAKIAFITMIGTSPECPSASKMSEPRSPSSSQRSWPTNLAATSRRTSAT